ncbi:MAG TPA: deoxyribonuclease IV [bacterium]|nr:deoxyribonuclease IV [bacterium]
MKKFGAHVSIAGGVYKAPERGEKLGCDAIQIFTRNQMQWDSPPLSEDDVAKFRANVEKRRPSVVVTHASYLINLASPEDTKLEKSRAAFLEELQRCESLGIPYLVFHPGSHMGAGETAGMETIADSLNRAHAETGQSSVRTLLEITAGQGTNVGYTFEQLMVIIEQVSDQTRIGVCLDTSHMFAAGYDLREKKAYQQTWRQFDAVIGNRWLHVFHINDSKKALGSRVDRHENLGRGYLGLEAFRLLINDDRFDGIPMILETPGGNPWYVKNLKIMRDLVGEQKEAAGPKLV